MFGFRRPTPFVHPELAESLGATLTTHEMAAISALGTIVDLDAGFVLTTEGAIGREVVVIVEGSAIVSRGDDVLGTVGAGDIVGEMAALTGRPRNASIVATTPLKVAVFTNKEFWRLLETCPRITARVTDLIIARQPI
ncbi:MAG: Crp/Fnr family transcriptional regulator [Acidimicrobiales bacterium]